MTSILSKRQRILLAHLGAEPLLRKYFYFGGGTVLAEYYLHHRYSEDLDFFSEEEFDPQAISAILQKLKKKAGIRAIHFQQSFNRNLFFCETEDETIKTEFTYFPFPRIDPSGTRDGMPIDSLEDIAVNKLFTIFQKPRARDFIDLYCILHEKPWTIAELISKARIKFDTVIDPIQLGAQFVRADELKDYPRLLIPLEPADWQVFFREEARKIAEETLE
ncbi:hypothetical protein A3A38_00130 [Candidatus Kaiserbacteria bacterium RIFCSPLOWO2_01_FULL_53_17]|uniref:Nucleotidyl transferase AbiEii/AbiGii toxin family protein n=1 Tax=Candidatus Kaiserbacteria bacterium RIFCSPLOWO2_01_FULL_53_17 TaxID=1798511 RepID=A0A1F6EG69_9BACT|nr:MAG: hypothetical protein A3A38_00130 [Candidatus Kaiserbacteria bacterium RIFCSPLOWO2_01_FULL_53_17]